MRWGQVFAVVKIVFYDTGSGNYFFFFCHHVPLWHRLSSLNAVIYAYQIFFQWDFPFLMKPVGCLYTPLRMSAKSDKVIRFHLDFSFYIRLRR